MIKLSLSVLSLIFLSACFFLTPIPEPESYFVEPDIDVRPAFKSYFNDAYALCRGDSFFVNWDLGDSSAGTLHAIPAASVEPSLSKQRTEPTGSQKLSLQQATTLELGQLQGPFDALAIEVEEIPASICQRLPEDFQADYEGVLEQSAPRAASFSRTLELSWRSETLSAVLYRTGESLQLRCDVEELINCRGSEEDEPDTFNLVGTFNGDVFEGTYEGKTEVGNVIVNFSGSAEFTKTLASP